MLDLFQAAARIRTNPDCLRTDASPELRDWRVWGAIREGLICECFATHAAGLVIDPSPTERAQADAHPLCRLRFHNGARVHLIEGIGNE
jgi:hypothetical protein